jgi:hypothetical protein
MGERESDAVEAEGIAGYTAIALKKNKINLGHQNRISPRKILIFLKRSAIFHAGRHLHSFLYP